MRLLVEQDQVGRAAFAVFAHGIDELPERAGLVETHARRVTVVGRVAGISGPADRLIHLQHVDAQRVRLVNHVAEKLFGLRRAHAELVRMPLPVAGRVGFVQHALW